jgi:ribonuclease HII
MALQRFYSNSSSFEIGVDEAGRGPMFGRVYVSAVILPKEDNYDFSSIKDSKKFTSKKKIKEVAEFIKKNAIAWSVQYAENDTIDKINIREAVLLTMNRCIDDILQKMGSTSDNGVLILVDGNDFRPYMVCDEETMELSEINHVTVEQGDSKYYSIAAASILAKVTRDEYILDLCEQYPILVENYGLNTNMGYGTKRHMEGIVKHGITQWHRRSYGICKVGGTCGEGHFVPDGRRKAPSPTTPSLIR